LNHEVESVCKLLERTIPKMIQIETRLDHPLDLISADSVQLEQILMNLAINARDAMPEGGKLILETRNTILDDDFCKKNIGAHPGKYVCFSIGDNGCGMEKRILDRIFEPFFTTKETGKGTGLGLSMVYGIVKNHKGYITCRSTQGKGTQFDLYFPAIVMEKENGADAGADKVLKEIPKGTETLLLVDDEAPLREIGKAMLQRFGYTVWEAENGEQAVALYREKKDQVHLVLLDLNMPGMGGYKCYQELLRMDPNVKIVVASGFLEDQRSKRVLASGVKAFVEKPYRVNELVTAVRNALEGK
ncbi:MAG: response regulator, partial [Deltaproteobacteria bacterium]|nr:response regulator [Deltaproteobacteria bacterium]